MGQRFRLMVLVPMSSIILATPLTFLHQPAASAASTSGWQAGRIIDDTVFADKNSMSVQQIQDFLNQNVGTAGAGHTPGVCDTSGTQTSELGGGTRAQYGAAHGNPAPFTCLKDYYEVPKTAPGPGMPENNYGGKTIPAGAESAAQLVWDASQRYNISPKVLLVTIKKESIGPLTSDDWPLLSQYTYAMGAHCPDSGPNRSANCDPNYAGFSIQISESAALLRYYLDNMTQSWWPYKKLGNNVIQYNPDTSCGSSTVNILTSATAALYTYTPYQPNAAALAAGYGTASCGAYGNRNFWLYYNDWFGPTNGSPFFSYNGQVFMIGDNNTYYYVPSQALLNAYGISSAFHGAISYVDPSFTASMTSVGSLPWVARFASNAIYEFDSNGLHQFLTPDTYAAFGYTFGNEAVLPSYLAASYAVSTPMQPVVFRADRPEVYYVNNGSKHHITTPLAYSTLGSPTYNSQASVQVSSNYASTILEGSPILTAGEVVQNADTKQVSIWANGTLNPVSDSAVSTWGLGIDYSRPDAIIGKLPSTTLQLGLFVTSSDGTKYLLDGGRKYMLSTALVSQLLGQPTFQTINSEILNRFSLDTLTSSLRQTNSAAVYSLSSNKLYHIYDYPDLVGLGVNPTTISVLNVQPSAIFADSGGSIFTAFRLVRVQGTAAVYITDGTLTMRHIPTENIMQQYGFLFNNVNVVRAADLSTYVTGPDLGQLVSDNSGSLWVIDSGCKQKFANNLLGAYGFTADQFVTLNSGVLSQIPSCVDLTNLIQASGQPAVYLLNGGVKHWIPTEAILKSSGYNRSQVRVVSPAFVNSISSGANVQ